MSVYNLYSLSLNYKCIFIFIRGFIFIQFRTYIIMCFMPFNPGIHPRASRTLCFFSFRLCSILYLYFFMSIIYNNQVIIYFVM